MRSFLCMRVGLRGGLCAMSVISLTQKDFTAYDSEA